MNRRRFICTAALAAPAVFSASSWARVEGANSDIRVGIAGIGIKGVNHLRKFGKIPGVRLVALCDPDTAQLDRGLKVAEEEHGPQVREGIRTFVDYREFVQSNEIDAVVIASPNHWHALMAVWAMQLGKDVYLEKPMSHDIREGRVLLEVQKKYGRIIQHGTQRRCDPEVNAVVRYVQSGQLGKILIARGLCYKRRPSIGNATEPVEIPKTVDYDLWCGPAKKLPLMRQKLHYDWHWIWNTGNGDIGNNGVHQMDVCNWITGDRPAPSRVISLGGRFGYEDNGETPNTQIAYFDYDDMPILFEVRGLEMTRGSGQMPHYRGLRTNILIQCEGGYATETSIYDNRGERMDVLDVEPMPVVHENFIEAVRAGKSSLVRSRIDKGHISCTLAHLANTSYRVGTSQNPSEVFERIKGSPYLVEALGRMTEHLGNNGVYLSKDPARIGPWLSYDAKREKYHGAFAGEANAYLTREYRAPYTLP